MAKRLDVGPKAVIDHLEMLERAGLVECYQEQGRRKYFRIARRTVLEIAVSPHSYGVRAYLSEDAPKDASGFEEAEASLDLKMLKDELMGLEKKRHELRELLAQIESREMEIKQRASCVAGFRAENQLESEIMTALLSGGANSSQLATRLEVPEAVVLDSLNKLKERSAVHLRGQEWSI
jgi:ArsR family transcriptional regulator